MSSTIENGAPAVENGVSSMNGTKGDNVKEVQQSNGTGPVDGVQQLALDLLEASKNLNKTEGQENLRLRTLITGNARQIIDQIRDPGETPFEYSTRMGELGCLRMLMELGAFDHIPLEGDISYAELGKAVGAEESLITRFCWMLVSTGMLKQNGEDRVAHSRFSKIYVTGNPQGAFFQIMFDEAMVPYTRWPAYFEKFGLKEPTTGNLVPSSFAWGHEELNFWDMISKFPKREKTFNQSMATLDLVLPVLGMYDYSWIGEYAENGADKDRTLIVDVGSGKGQALKRIMEAVPKIPGSRLVMQDRPVVMEEVGKSGDKALEGVKLLPHNFFDEQPVKGALVYFIRRIIHDWHDENCAKILGRLAHAMAPDSRVLICEQIMSNPPSQLSAQTDVCMMGLGAKERTEKMFEKLVPASNLKLIKVWKSTGTDVAVIECAKGDNA